MFSLLRYKRHGLPYGLITIHELMIRDIFQYFEKGPFVRKKVRSARKAIGSALRFARKKKVYPSIKTAEALNVLGQLYDEIEYTHKVILAAFVEAQNTIKLIKQEKALEIIPLVEKSRELFKNNNLQDGTEKLKEAQEKLKSNYLEVSRKTILGGFESDIKKLKHELREKS